MCQFCNFVSYSILEDCTDSNCKMCNLGKAMCTGCNDMYVLKADKTCTGEFKTYYHIQPTLLEVVVSRWKTMTSEKNSQQQTSSSGAGCTEALRLSMDLG